MAEEFQQKEGEISPLTQSLSQYWSEITITHLCVTC